VNREVGALEFVFFIQTKAKNFDNCKMHDETGVTEDADGNPTPGADDAV
jgi:hypothetical protein